MKTILAETYPRLLGDIGGTNARFAIKIAEDLPFTEPVVLRCRDYAGLPEAIEHYLSSNHLPQPRWAALAIATAVSGDEVNMTNNHWSFSIKKLQSRIAVSHLRVLNDFTALAMAIPGFNPEDLSPVGGGQAIPGKAIGLLGAGTGLGISGLIPNSQGFIPLEGEGGHLTLAASNPREEQLISQVRRKLSHVSAERLLSGPGLSALYEAVATLQDARIEELAPGEISQRGVLGSCPICRETIETFCAMLGTVAADLALVLGARGGIYIGGGIVPQLGPYFLTSPFRSRFEQKGRFSDYLAAIPTWVIRAPWPGLLGVARILDEDEKLVGHAA